MAEEAKKREWEAHSMLQEAQKLIYDLSSELHCAKLLTMKEDGCGSNSDTVCCICLDLPREIMFLPCGHLSVCNNCCDKLRDESNQCPICEKTISSGHKVYLS